MAWKKLLFLLSLCICLCSISGISYGQEKVRLGLGFLTGSAGGVFAAIEGNTFKKQNLDVTTILISSSAAILPALLAGEVDMITIAPQAVFRAYISKAQKTWYLLALL